MSLKSVRGSGGNAEDSVRSACRNSGLPAAPPCDVRLPGSRSAMQAKASTSAPTQAPNVSHGWRLHALARTSVIACECAGLGRAAQLLVEWHQRDRECLDRLCATDDVVAVLEH